MHGSIGRHLNPSVREISAMKDSVKLPEKVWKLRLKTAFLVSAAFILLLSGGAKLLSATQRQLVLGVTDPVFPFLKVRQVFAIAGALELCMVPILVWYGTPKVRVLLLLWLSTLFWAYRFGLWVNRFELPCPCLGNTSDWLGVSPTAVHRISVLILIYFTVGSFALLTTRYSRASN